MRRPSGYKHSVAHALQNAVALHSVLLVKALTYNLLVTKRATRRLSIQLPSTSVGEWCASVASLQ